jgi:hypothetical protein
VKRTIFAFAVLVAAWVGFTSIGAHGQGAAAGGSGTTEEDVFLREVPAVVQAWQFSGVDLPPGYAAVISATGKWSYWPAKGTMGPAGNGAKTKDANLVKSGPANGCLLVRTGDTVLAFAKDDQVIRVTTPGPIYFCCNDTRTDEGTRRAAGSVHALPIKGSGDKGMGFTDNTGVLLVRIAVSKAD